MTITHKTVQEEAHALTEILNKGDISIPDFWKCAWPGGLLILWLLIWPVIAFGLFGSPNEGIVIAIGMGGFLGFLVSMAIFNARSLYLALPDSFRRESKVLSLIQKKARNYFLTYVGINFVAGCIVENNKAGSFVYTFVTIGAVVFLAFIFAADIGRYRLSAFNSVLEMVKSRKHGGE